jgi:mannose-1-phosphate guanylyltransferase/mannose-1-phosphate guanylyltransferase/mannose-6-phosphate isomerase
MFDDCIVMAGGSGTRLWPASNSQKPKQFLSISQGRSFFQAAVERALSAIDGSENGRVIIIAGKTHTPHITEACTIFGPEERKRLVLIPEPAAKNTAPAIACGLIYAGKVSGQDRNILVLTSDHIIKPLEKFKAAAAAAAAFARQDKLVVFGIPPAAAETAYGYIETAEFLRVPEAQNNSPPGKNAEPEAYRAVSFREKPDKGTAEEFLKRGTFYWNSGMFAFSSQFMLREFRRAAPELILPFDKLEAPKARSYSLMNGLQVLEDWENLETAYKAVKNISIDYAIAEKCGQTVMVRAGFEWIDVGSWDEYARLVEDAGAETYCSASDSCFVDSDIPVALCGAEDLIVVIRSGRDGRPPAALIAKKGETQRVKEIVEKIKAAGRVELL